MATLDGRTGHEPGLEPSPPQPGAESTGDEIDAAAVVEIAAVPLADQRWALLQRVLPADLDDARVLLLGGDADHDGARLARRGAAVHRIHGGWQELDATQDGPFDLVLCDALLHRDAHPVALLQAVRSVLAPGGALVLGSAILAGPEGSETLRVVPGSYAGDPTWWMVPGRLALRWMVEAAGFRVDDELLAEDGPRGEFPVRTAYLRATADTPSPLLGSARG
jgi:hypothetical protein